MGNYYIFVVKFSFLFDVSSHVYKDKIEKIRNKVCYSTAVYTVLQMDTEMLSCSVERMHTIFLSSINEI